MVAFEVDEWGYAVIVSGPGGYSDFKVQFVNDSPTVRVTAPSNDFGNETSSIDIPLGERHWPYLNATAKNYYVWCDKDIQQVAPNVLTRVIQEALKLNEERSPPKKKQKTCS